MMVEQQYIELFSQTEAMICKHSAEVLNAPRASAFADFERLGFPTRKMEKYKYTDVSKYFEPDFGLNLNRLAIPVNPDRKSTRLNSSHDRQSRMPSSA